MKERRANQRIRLLLILFGAVFVVVIGRAAYLQAVQHDRFSKMATTQHRETIEVPAGRGTIYDRTGEPLAIGEQATTVYANPRNITDAQRAAIVVGKALGLDPDTLYPVLKDRSKGFIYVARKASPASADALRKREIPGVGFYPEELRTYPQGNVASHVLGFAGTDNHGLDGLERSLDKTLAGKAGFETIVKDPFGRAIDVVTSKAEQPGRNVTLTIDHQIQANAEQVIERYVRQFGARGAAAIVMDPRTGAILAMANYPTFDANHFSTASPDARRNRAVTDAYEPGSTFKIVAIAGALEDNIVSPTTTFTLAPTIQVADRVIHEAHTRGTEVMSVTQILAHSSNIGTITVAEKLGSGELSSWIDRFGFGKPTGIDYPGESSGLVLPLADWSGSTIGTVPIGQGIAVTPLQMVSAYATIGNGGIRRTPRLIEKIGNTRVHGPTGKRVVSRHTADRMMAMFRDVVLEGTGTEAAIPGYTVAGKTGTAQKAENGRYVRKYVASFVGLVPAKKPRFAILVMVDEPRGNIYGGVVAAPAFRDIARFALQYTEVQPDAPETRTSLVAAGAPSTR
ncbi:MAG: penicillin-binding protein 2 [Thermoleophilia bacterium]